MERIQKKKICCNKNGLGKDIELDRLIVLDDVSGLADRSDTFENFLSVMKIRTDVRVCFLYTLPDKTKLAYDTCTNKNFQRFP